LVKAGERHVSLSRKKSVQSDQFVGDRTRKKGPCGEKRDLGL